MEYDISKEIMDIDFSLDKLVDFNGLMLTNREINALKRYGVDYTKCSTLKQVLFEIDKIFEECSDDDLEELDYISSTIAERDYYQNTNK